MGKRRTQEEGREPSEETCSEDVGFTGLSARQKYLKQKQLRQGVGGRVRFQPSLQQMVDYGEFLKAAQKKFGGTKEAAFEHALIEVKVAFKLGVIYDFRKRFKSYLENLTKNKALLNAKSRNKHSLQQGAGRRFLLNHS